MNTYRVAVTGGRDHQITGEEAGRLHDILLGLRYLNVVLLHGNARGVDRQVANLAESWGYPVVPFEAPWDHLKKLLGEEDPRWKAAGHIRNGQLLAAADLLVAFPGGKGTADCVRQVRELGVEVVEIASPEPKEMNT